MSEAMPATPDPPLAGHLAEGRYAPSAGLAGDGAIPVAAPSEPRSDGDPEPFATGGEITPELAAALIQRVFGAGILLAGASSIVGESPAAERLASAAAELDLLVREIRQAVFSQRP
jgi:hypothetical protein